MFLYDLYLSHIKIRNFQSGKMEYIFWGERKKWGNFQCKNVWKNEKNSDKLDFVQ